MENSASSSQLKSKTRPSKRLNLFLSRHPTPSRRYASTPVRRSPLQIPTAKFGSPTWVLREARRIRVSADLRAECLVRPFGGGGPGGFGGFRQSGAAYSSPIAITFGGKRQYVQLTANALIGVDASNGALLWEYAKPANGMGINCTTPLYHEGVVFASSAYGAGGGAVKLSDKTDGTIEANELYFTKRMQNHHGGIILLDGCLYGANGGNGGGNLICIDFETGEVLWDERRGEQRIPKGSIAYADGRLVLSH